MVMLRHVNKKSLLLCAVDESISITKDKHLPRQNTDSFSEEVFENDVSQSNEGQFCQNDSKSGTSMSKVTSTDFTSSAEGGKGVAVTEVPTPFEVIIFNDLSNGPVANDQLDGASHRESSISKVPLETNLDELSLSGSQSTLTSLKAESLQNIQRVSEVGVRDSSGDTGDLRPEDENRNKLFELRVDAKGNVQRIVVQEQLGSDVQEENKEQSIGRDSEEGVMRRIGDGKSTNPCSTEVDQHDGEKESGTTCDDYTCFSSVCLHLFILRPNYSN